MADTRNLTQQTGGRQNGPYVTAGQQSSEVFWKLDGDVPCGIALNASIRTNDLI